MDLDEFEKGLPTAWRTIVSLHSGISPKNISDRKLLSSTVTWKVFCKFYCSTGMSSKSVSELLAKAHRLLDYGSRGFRLTWIGMQNVIQTEGIDKTKGYKIAQQILIRRKDGKKYVSPPIDIHSEIQTFQNALRGYALMNDFFISLNVLKEENVRPYVDGDVLILKTRNPMAESEYQWQWQDIWTEWTHFLDKTKKSKV